MMLISDIYFKKVQASLALKAQRSQRFKKNNGYCKFTRIFLTMSCSSLCLKGDTCSSFWMRGMISQQCDCRLICITLIRKLRGKSKWMIMVQPGACYHAPFILCGGGEAINYHHSKSEKTKVHG